MNFEPNLGKKLVVEIDGKKWARYPVKTHFVQKTDSLDEILKKYVLKYLEKGDIVVLGQKIISILQARIVYKKDIKLGFWAKFLSKFAKKTSYGFSVGNPLKMQLAIDMAGLPRIIFAGILGGILKIFGLSGNFYRLAGHQISQIDGFYGKAFPQYAEMGIFAPKNCSELCQELQEKYGFSFAVGDINDLGGNILGTNKELKGREKLLLAILKDNPSGQSDEQTPILILRNLKRVPTP